MLQIPARSTPVSPCMPCPRFGSYPLRRAGVKEGRAPPRGASCRWRSASWRRMGAARPAALRRHGGDPGGGVARRGALALGLVSEEAYYRALAAELGLPFVRHPRVSALARFPHSLTAGLAPAPGRGFVTAPPARGTGRLLAVRRRLGGPVAVTTPSGLRAAVFAAAGPRIADLAAHDLPRQRSALSYRDGTTLAQIALAALASAGSSAGLVLAPGLVGALVGLGLGALFFGMVVLRFAALRIDAPISPPELPPRQPDHLLPVYTVVAPLRGESRVVRKLIAALRALDYPAAKLDIKIVIEADDRETADAIEEVGLAPWMAVVTAPPGEPRTKPRALNVALPLARGAFTVVYDAEDEPQPDQLRLAVALFASQGPRSRVPAGAPRHRQHGRRLDSRLFTIEYATLFDVLNPALAAMGLPIPLGGTSNHFRTSALRRVGGWDAWNVTEDADLGIRLARFAYRTVDLPSSTHEEAPRSLGAWMRQRTRWMKGYMQTCVTHSRHPVRLGRELGWAGLAGVVATLRHGDERSRLSGPHGACPVQPPHAPAGLGGGRHGPVRRPRARRHAGSGRFRPEAARSAPPAPPPAGPAALLRARQRRGLAGGLGADLEPVPLEQDGSRPGAHLAQRRDQSGAASPGPLPPEAG